MLNNQVITILDRLHVAAMQKADTVSFHHCEGRNYLRCSKKHKATAASPFEGESKIEIDCESLFVDYEGDYSMRNSATFKGFDMIHRAQYDDAWQTVAHLAKPGDLLQLHWQHGAQTTDGLRERDMAGDVLQIIIVRGARKMTFNISHYHGPARSLARMIRDVVQN
jgi:hypothetical protein